MIRRTTWITLAVFIVLLGFTIWWTNFRPQSQEDITIATPMPLWTLTAADVEMLRVEDPAIGEAVELHRDADELWVLVEPVSAAAEPARVESAVIWLEAPVPTRTLDQVDDLALYGLMEPRRVVEIELKDGSNLILNVGREAPTGAVVYVRVDDRPEIHTMSIFALNTVLDLLSEIPLPAPTPTLTSSPTEIPTDTEATETPTVEATATP
jgi:hypothetical protein